MTIPEPAEPPGVPPPPSPPRRRWRAMASLRTTLILLAVLAVGFGVLANRARDRKKGLDLIRQHGGTYWYDFEFDAGGAVLNTGSWAPAWLRSVVGDENLHTLTYVRIVDSSSFSDDDLAFLTRVFPRIQSLAVDHSAITDRGLGALQGNPEVCGLFLKNRGITDAGVDRLDIRTLPKLSIIDFRGTKVTRAKMAELSKILSDREAQLKRDNPGKQIPSHFVLD